MNELLFPIAAGLAVGGGYAIYAQLKEIVRLLRISVDQQHEIKRILDAVENELSRPLRVTPVQERFVG